MKKTVEITLAILALISASAFAQIGVGPLVGYPVGYAFPYVAEYGELPSPPPIFVGATVRWKPSALVVDFGVDFWGSGSASLLYGFLDLGVGLDLWIFRFGLAGGFDVVNISVPGYQSYSAVGPSARISLDLKFGPVTVGANMAFPIDVVLSFIGGGDIDSGDNFLRLFAGHASICVVYWFGGAEKARTRIR